ncbi:MAG TPA: hypothetical protein VIM02_08710 [Rhizomicrobium sp.]|jgi:hypothetical protein
MKNSRLVEEAKLAPDRIYSRPQDILRDRRLADPERLEILSAWEREARGGAAEDSAGEMSGDASGLLREIEQARREIEGRTPST